MLDQIALPLRAPMPFFFKSVHQEFLTMSKEIDLHFHPRNPFLIKGEGIGLVRKVSE